MHYWNQNQSAEIYFCLLFQFFTFSISCSKVMNMEIFLKDFSGTTWILKFGIKTSGMTGCTVYQRISHIWHISPFICPFFFLSKQFFPSY